MQSKISEKPRDTFLDFFVNPSHIERFTQNQDLHKISLLFKNIYIVFHQCEKCKDTFACKYSLVESGYVVYVVVGNEYQRATSINKEMICFK